MYKSIAFTASKSTKFFIPICSFSLFGYVALPKAKEIYIEEGIETYVKYLAETGKALISPFKGGLEHFTLAAISGSIGAATVYPIDLVKTRMQNQRTLANGTKVYKHSLDCFLKVVKNEGFLGLYKGLGPQLLGVTPEKALELTVNDLMRGWLLSDANEKNFYRELIAGCVAGGSQVIFTNPVEIIKIRLQVQGEQIKSGLIAESERRTASQIFREVGFKRLYFGASACLLRDVPFSGMYFTTYARMKKIIAKDSGNPFGLLLAGAVSGIPAAGLVTPADVIKTRLQAQQFGEMTYRGISDCARKIWATEGFSAFFKGAGARVCRSSPQFGVTLLSYELLQKKFHGKTA